MKYRIDARYVWYNRGTQLVLMYFINGVPFTFDDVPESYMYVQDVLDEADEMLSRGFKDQIYNVFKMLQIGRAHV